MSGRFGIIRGESLLAYHSNPAVSSTRLMDMRPCALFYKMRHIDKTLPKESKTEFDIGNAAHWLILEGRNALDARTVEQPRTYQNDKGEVKAWTYAANVCKAWRDTHPGKVILTAADFATIDRMAAAVGENPDAVALLTGGESEVTFRVQHPAFAVQCRADHYYKSATGAMCTDLKTCDSIEQFKAHYFKFRYYYRAAFYQDVIEQADSVIPEFRFVVSEKNAPFRCEVFEPTEGDLELGRAEMLADLKTLRTCMQTGVWPGSKLGVQPIELTAWQRKLSEGNAAALFEEVA